ncbi:Bromodomain and PHD finger-containing protein 1 [Cichlidogyrus casuarinus]|uniref:Bromodomain and PHD finger-containing protein 1 n=1 Tax=Cichlidogyrus casuarinus TaxID=1844966 RepID=A0ABD2QBF2_9PLAT
MTPKILVDFDINEFLGRIRGNKPPYKCPADGCNKVSKSFKAFEQHMMEHKPPEPIEIPILIDHDATENDKSNAFSNNSFVPGVNANSFSTMSFAESKNFIMFDATSSTGSTTSQTYRCNIHVPLNIILKPFKDAENQTVSPSLSASLKSNSKTSSRSRNKSKRGNPRMPLSTCALPNVDSIACDTQTSTETLPDSKLNILQTPVPIFEEDPDYKERPKIEINETSSYLHFQEFTNEELNEMVEYDLDEEDIIWLDLINADRLSKKQLVIGQSVLEWVLDRFEKLSKFQTKSRGKNKGRPSVGSEDDDDDVCAVCLDGHCENTNMILFCDVCNLAVHQECYGVPYVPEGPWLCRKCLHSPSEPVQCCLCPNAGGAFKKTSDDRWAHVLCGLWVPEVMFANLTFLEPLEDIDKIAPARWRLQCFICKQRNCGACIQCHKSNCYRAFHVTCAQQAGLYMKIEHSNRPGDSGVRKNAFCDIHCPPDHFNKGNRSMYAHSDSNEFVSDDARSDRSNQLKKSQLRKVRKMLAQRRTNVEKAISLPFVPKCSMEQIINDVRGIPSHKIEFLQHAYAFWKAKRVLRRGVPLLKRLQASSSLRSVANLADDDKATEKMREQSKFWQQLRHDLEKARLLSELTRKRERVKRELFRLFVKQTEISIQPMRAYILNIIEKLQDKDRQHFFAEPVSESIAPDYYKVIKHPMDFRTMSDKCARDLYSCVEDVEKDFNLMMDNCMEYNLKESVYYKTARRLKDLASVLFKEAKEVADDCGLDKSTGLLRFSMQEKCYLDPMIFMSNDSSLSSQPLDSNVTVALKVEDIPSPVSMSKHKRPISPSTSSITSSSSRRRQIQKSPNATPTNENCSSNTRFAQRKREDAVTSRTPQRVSKRRQSDSPEKRPAKLPKIDMSTEKSVLVNGPLTPTDAGGSRVSSPAQNTHTSPLFKNRRDASLRSSRRSTRTTSIKSVRQSSSAEESSAANSECSSEDIYTSDDSTEVLPLLNGCSKNEDDIEVKTDTESSATTVTVTEEACELKRHSLRQRASTRESTLAVCGRSKFASRERTRSQSRYLGNFSRKYCISRIRNAKNILSRRSKRRRREEDADSDLIMFDETGPGSVDQGQQTASPNSATQDEYSTDENSQNLIRNALSAGRTASVFEAKDPVWAKCPGSPWYPALIIDPCAKDGYEHNGVMLPLPTASVLMSGFQRHVQLSLCLKKGKNKNADEYLEGKVSEVLKDLLATLGKEKSNDNFSCEELRSLFEKLASQPSSYLVSSLFLVVFFDTKRTWQWLTQDKLVPLAFDLQIDKKRLSEGRKSKMRMSVQKAYARAIEHLCKVHLKSYPFSGGRPVEPYLIS